MRYFWREKNADTCIGKGKISIPTKEELKKELVLKIEQKLSRIDVVFDKKEREKYYLKDKKPKKSLEGLTEEEIVCLLGKNLAVDFLQLCFDLERYYDVKVVLKENVSQNTSVNAVKNEAKNIVRNLKKEKCQPVVQIERLFEVSKKIAELARVNWEDVVFLQRERENKEGSFFNGKYVDIELV